MSEERFDRIERNIEIIVEQQAQLTLRQIEASELHDREMGEIRKGLNAGAELHDQEMSAIRKELNRGAEQHDQEMGAIRRQLGRAVRLSVEEARRERVKRRELASEFDDKITKIAAAQLINEELLRANEALLKAFLQRGGNGRKK